MIKAVFLFVLTFNACVLSSERKKEKLPDKKTEYFGDINLYNMEGVGKIGKTPSFPYIQIDYVGEKERNITYHASKTNEYKLEYFKVNNNWVTSFISNGDTCSIITYEYVTKSKVIDWYYCYNSNINDTILNAIVVLENSTETFYKIENEPNITPDINAIDLVVSRSKFVLTKDIDIKNNILVIKEMKKNKTDKVPSYETSCYEIGEHSYFWWRYFGWTKKKIECK